MEKLKGFQRKYLRGVAHSLKAVVLIGQKGNTEAVLKAVEDALEVHELIKIKFIDCKEKEQKNEIIRDLEIKTESEMVGMIGHTAIFYRKQTDPDKSKIILPEK
jgi:RNA-binding protein